MLKLKLAASSVLLVLLSLPFFIGCSGEEKPKNDGLVNRVIDSLSVAVAENIGPALDSAIKNEPENSAHKVLASTKVEFSEKTANDMMILSNQLLIASDDGLYIVDKKTRESKLIKTEGALHAIISHGGEIYTGGEALYRLSGETLVDEEISIIGTISSLESFNQHLIIGTTNGVYTKSMLGTFNVFNDIEVVAITADNDGLWIGTNGQGLYRYDGEIFKRRFLSRDSSLFDFVTDVAFNHDHLYVGTESSFFVYDGGKWKEYNNEDGFISTAVNSIDASGWIVYLATDLGLYQLYDGDLTPVDRLEDKNINLVRRDGLRLFVDVDSEGLFMKAGEAVQPMVFKAKESQETLISAMK